MLFKSILDVFFIDSRRFWMHFKCISVVVRPDANQTSDLGPNQLGAHWVGAISTWFILIMIWTFLLCLTKSMSRLLWKNHTYFKHKILQKKFPNAKNMFFRTNLVCTKSILHQVIILRSDLRNTQVGYNIYTYVLTIWLIFERFILSTTFFKHNDSE